MKNKQLRVRIEIDGSCHGQGKPHAKAGYSVVVRGAISKNIIGKVEGEQDSLRAELTAFLKALEFLKEYPAVKADIITDSLTLKKLVYGEEAYGDFQEKYEKFFKVAGDIWLQIENTFPSVASQVNSVQWTQRENNTVANLFAGIASRALILPSENMLSEMCS